MPGRTFSAGNGYRYGFNGKENDNEVKGQGGEQDYGMRIYNPRIGRFLSVDPLTNKYAFYTPYQFSGNMPIVATDLDGGEPRIKNTTTETCGYAPYVSAPYRGTIQPVDIAQNNGQMVYGSSRAIESFEYKGYRILPNYVTTAQGNEILSHYTASVWIKDPADGFRDVPRIDWVIPANQLETFKQKIGMYSAAANFLFGANKHMSKSTIEFWNGHWGKGYLELTKEQLKNPFTYLALAEGAIALTSKPRINPAIAEDLKGYNNLRAAYLDCSEIASAFAETYKGGTILEMTPKSGRWMVGLEYGETAEFTYHQVFVKDGMVYDPMFGSAPMKTAEFIKKYKEMNPGGLNFTWTRK